MDINFIDKTFKEYVNTFNMEDENIYLKYEHTFEVVKFSESIARKLNLSEEDTNLAKAIAYFHDIGRFEQVTLTNTFQDSVMDHADYGIDLLFNRGLIEKFNIDKKYYQVIYKAVKNHNKLEILDELEKDEEVFVKLIRDADKVDIYRVRVKYMENLFIGVPQEININDFYSHKLINLKNRKSKSDSLLCVMAFVYDFNFKETKEVLKETKYYQEFIRSIKVGDEAKDIFNKAKEEVYRYLDIKEC